MTDLDREELIAAIAQAVAERAKPASLSEEEQRWVRLAIQKEAQSIQLRKAIIEKTLSGLVWAALLGLGMIFLEFAKSHGYKP
jgi:hypothetical protein